MLPRMIFKLLLRVDRDYATNYYQMINKKEKKTLDTKIIINH